MTMVSPVNAAALLLPLVGSTLLVCTATASLPALLLSQRQPRDPGLPAEALASEQVVARGAGRRWYLNQQPIAADRLARLLAETGGSGDSGEVVLVVSRTLSLADVSDSLVWLRQVSPRPVRLEPGLDR
jgi:hypothetical protein